MQVKYMFNIESSNKCLLNHDMEEFECLDKSLSSRPAKASFFALKWTATVKRLQLDLDTKNKETNDKLFECEWIEKQFKMSV